MYEQLALRIGIAGTTKPNGSYAFTRTLRQIY